jgi:hypothetical protein
VLPKSLFVRELNASAQFRTLQRAGQILTFSGVTSRDFLAVSLTNTFIQVSFNLGGGTATRVFPGALNDGLWHSVAVHLKDNIATVRVDGTIVGTVEGSSAFVFMNPGDDSRLSVGKDFVGLLADVLFAEQNILSMARRAEPQGFTLTNVEWVGLDAVLPAPVTTTTTTAAATSTTRSSSTLASTTASATTTSTTTSSVTTMSTTLSTTTTTTATIAPTTTSTTSSIRTTTEPPFTASTGVLPDSIAARFIGTSTLSYTLPQRIATNTATVTLRFRTQDRSAMLLSMTDVGGEDSLSVSILDGNIFVSFNLGGGLVGLQAIHVPVSDGVWHTAVFTLQSNNGQLEIDGTFAGTILAPALYTVRQLWFTSPLSIPHPPFCF